MMINYSGISLCAVIFLFGASISSFPQGGPYHYAEYDVDHQIALEGIDSVADQIPYMNDGASDFEKGGGSNYDDGYFNAAGEKGNNGYNKYDGFEKGRLSRHGADGKKSHYNDQGARQAGHVDQSNYYTDKNAIIKGSKGGDFAVSNSYNKGSKTTGFHNVHHKEEYKKNRKFYDESQKSGHYSRYGDFGAALIAAAGGSANGKRYDQGYRDANYGKQGFADRGSLYNDLKQYAAANGYDDYYGNRGDYSRRGGAQQGQVHGFSH